MNITNNLYTQVAEEMDNGIIDKGLWAKATEMSPNDANRIKSKYIGLRVRELKTEDRKIKRKKILSALKVIIPTAIAIIVSIATIIWIEEEKSHNAYIQRLALEKEQEDREKKEFELAKKNIELFPGQNAEGDNITFSKITTTEHGGKAPEEFLPRHLRLYMENYGTEGEFMSVSFLVTNTASTTMDLTSMSYILHDTNDRSFTLIGLADKCGDIEIKPNIPCKIEVLFETAPDSVLSKITFDYHTSH